ncbi:MULTISPECIES: Fic family protein [Helicobacter]|nr:Fic family protein [Helicobacter sp. MIT 03-1614]
MMIEYNPEFLEKTSFLGKAQSDNLRAICADIDLNEIIANIENRKSIAHKLCFDFIYTSAIIEGNTYTRGEAETLFETRLPISSKSVDDANMLLNIKYALDYILQEKPTITKHSIREIHQILSQGLLPKKAQGGVRELAVTIGNSEYVPLSNPLELELQMERMISYYQKIDNPFNKAIYIHNNTAYLQYFQDCNKRLARILQNLSLINDNMPFLSLNASRAQTEIKAQYKDAMIAYYESGDSKPYVSFFVSEYTKTLQAIKQISTPLIHKNTNTSPQPTKSKRR